MKHLKILFALSLLPAASAVSAEALDRASDFVGNSERTKVVAGDGCLQVKDSPFYVFTVKRFPVKPGVRYVVRAKFRDPSGPKPMDCSFGVQMFDAGGRVLCGSNSSEIPETFTTLVAPLSKGDRTVRVKDALYWKTGGVAVGAQADGSDFPNNSIAAGVKSVKRCAADDWEIELAAPSRQAAAAGTGVRLQPGGPAYFFAQSSRRKDGWTVCEGRFALVRDASTAAFYRKTAAFRLVAYAALGKNVSVDFGGVEVVEERQEAPGAPKRAASDLGVLSSTPDYQTKALNKVTFLKTPEHADLTLIEGGRLRFAIVAAQKEEEAFTGPDGLKLQDGQKSVRKAVRVICEGFRRACGKTPVVVEPDDPSLENWPCWLVVGKNAVTDRMGLKPYELPQEGFEVRTFARGIVIAGMDGFRVPGTFDIYDFRSRRMTCNGTVWGVWDFLERFLDQRVYYPGFGGELVPPLGVTFTVRPVAYRDAPKYWSRGYSINGHGAYRSGNSSRFFGGESPHPFDLIRAFPDKTNELFVTQKGKLQCDPKTYGKNFFDVSNPVFAETLAGAFAKYFETKGAYNPLWGGTFIPNSEWCWFGQCDRGGLIETEWSKPYIERNVDKQNHLTPTNYPGSAAMSSVYAAFFDRFGRLMEKAAPGRKVACEVYSDYLYPPTKWTKKLPDNIRIMTCFGTPPMVKNEGFRAAYRRVYEGWRALTSGPIVPYIYSAGWSFGAGIQLSLQGWYMGDYLKEYADLFDERAAYACLCGWTKLFFPAIDLCARAMWNPDFDRRSHMDEMWRRLYPRSGAALRRFHDGVIDIWETKTMPRNPDVYYNSLAGPRYANLYETFDEKWMLESLELFAEARAAAVPGTREGAAVEKFVRPWIDLVVARLDGVKQRMVTDERPNLVPPAKEGDAFVWSVYAWNRADMLDHPAKGGVVGFAPKGKAPGASAYLHGGTIGFRAERNTASKSAVFSFEMKSEDHPGASASAAAKYAVYVNGRRLDAGTLPKEWKKVTVVAPPGLLGAGVNTLAVSNVAECAGADLGGGWLRVRRPAISYKESAAPPSGDDEPASAAPVAIDLDP